jgi:hypothetical protein
MFGQEHFDARAGGFGGFDEDEFVFVGQDHRISVNGLISIAAFYCAFLRMPRNPDGPRS